LIFDVEREGGGGGGGRASTQENTTLNLCKFIQVLQPDVLSANGAGIDFRNCFQDNPRPHPGTAREGKIGTLPPIIPYKVYPFSLNWD